MGPERSTTSYCGAPKRSRKRAIVPQEVRHTTALANGANKENMFKSVEKLHKKMMKEISDVTATTGYSASAVARAAFGLTKEPC